MGKFINYFSLNQVLNFLFMCLDVIVLITNSLYLKWFCRYLVRVLEMDMLEQ